MGVGEGGEQNAPLARAVIGGLLFATFATLVFVPTMYRLLRRAPGNRAARRITHACRLIRSTGNDQPCRRNRPSCGALAIALL